MQILTVAIPCSRSRINECLGQPPSRPAGGTDHATEQRVRPRYVLCAPTTGLACDTTLGASSNLPVREPCCFQRARILFPSRPQTKSLSSHCANACSLLGRQSRLATSTSTRSAKGSLSAFCTRLVFGANPSRMFSRLLNSPPNHSQRLEKTSSTK